jgi:hypothetical protein
MNSGMYVVTVLYDFVPPFPQESVKVEAFTARHALNIVKKAHPRGIDYSVRKA